MRKQPTIRIQTVTPAQAKEWLKRNIKNRNLNKTVVSGYVDEIKQGRWRLTGDAVTFNTNGELINGQHRLNAVIQSGVPCSFTVMTDADVEVKEVIDLGRARSVPDVLRMIYGLERAQLITGAIRLIDHFVYNRRIKVTVGHALEYYERMGDAFKWASASVPNRSAFCASPVVAALVFAYRSDPDAVREFATQMFSGVGLEEHSATLLCRNHIMLAGNTGETVEERRRTFMVVLSAIRRHIEGGQVLQLRTSPEHIRYFLSVYGDEAPAAAEPEQEHAA